VSDKTTTREAAARAAATPVQPGSGGAAKGRTRARHIVPVSGGNLHPDASLADCLDCPVSCQSACKTSCTVGNQRCPK